MTFNTRGLNDPGKQQRLKLYTQAIHLKLDFLFLQENCLKKEKATSLGKFLSHQSTYVYFEAEPAYNNLFHELGAGVGGTAILIVPKWQGAFRQSL
jgi:hypothetical protein